MAAELLVSLLVLLASLSVLAKLSQYIIESAIVLSKYFRIGEAAFGFLLISVSTSLPEFLIAVLSSSSGQGSLSVGNVLGANIVNLTLVLGLGALVRPIIVKREDTLEISRILLIISIIPMVLIYTGNLDKFGGLLLLLAFFAYVYHISKRRLTVVAGDGLSRRQASRSFLIFTASIMGVLVAASFVVNSALSISEMTGIARTFLGATIVALGTTIPELTVTLQAVRKGHYSLALGNAIGSPLTNLTLVLGTVGLLNPLVINMAIFLTIMLFALGVNLLSMYFMSTNRMITKSDGIMLLGVYVIFLMVTTGVQLSIKHLLPF